MAGVVIGTALLAFSAGFVAGVLWLFTQTEERS